MENKIQILGFTIVLITSFIGIPFEVAEAQRISPEGPDQDVPSDSDTGSEDSRTGRIIPPEKFGAFKNQKQKRTISQEALIEKLKADSASMRIKYQERLREFRADSRTMRSQIQELQEELNKLRQRVDNLSNRTQSEDPDIMEPEPQKITKKREEMVTVDPEKSMNTQPLETPNTTPADQENIESRPEDKIDDKSDTGKNRSDSKSTEKEISPEDEKEKQESDGDQETSKDTDRKELQREPSVESLKSSPQEKSEQQSSTLSTPESLNPNRATKRELQSIPGITQRLAERIKWYRSEVRLFKKKNDLIRVPGIGRSLYNKISSFFSKGPY